MKTTRVVIFLVSLAILPCCREKQTRTNDRNEGDVPGVGMAHDSANQKLDSTIKAMDTTEIKP